MGVSLAFAVVLGISGRQHGFEGLRVFLLAGACLTFVSAAVVLIVSLFFGRDLTRHVTMMDKDIVAVGREAFYDYPEPIIIADENEKIIWYNRCFEDRLFPMTVHTGFRYRIL